MENPQDGAPVFDSTPPRALPPRHFARFVLAMLAALALHFAAWLALQRILIQLAAPSSSAEITSIAETDSHPEKPVQQRIAAAQSTAPSAVTTSPVLDSFRAAGAAMPVPQVAFASDWQPENTSATLGAAPSIFTGGGGMGVPKKMRARMSSASRQEMLLKNGGTPEVEQAVARALLWLREHQNSDGSWGQTYKAAMTGLAILAFLGHGDTPDSKEHGPSVAHASTYLTDLRARNGGIITTRPGSSQASYENGIATYALGEVYALARFGQKDLGPVVESFSEGVRIILRGQTRKGGWLYGYSQTKEGDMSVAGWQYQALKAAAQTNIPFPTLKEQLQRTASFLLYMRGPKGGFGYSSPGDRPSLTAVGVLGLQFIDAEKYKPAIVKGLKFMFENDEKDQWNSANLYTWYYNTQAAFQFGGSAWERWNSVFRDELLKNQKDNGGWVHGSTNGAQEDTDLFCTTLCTLMLEVYYRYERAE